MFSLPPVPPVPSYGRRAKRTSETPSPLAGHKDTRGSPCVRNRLSWSVRLLGVQTYPGPGPTASVPNLSDPKDVPTRDVRAPTSSPLAGSPERGTVDL